MPQRREERSKVNKQRRGPVDGVLAQLGASSDAKEHYSLLVGERLAAPRHQDFGPMKMNVLVHEAFKHKRNGGRRAHDDIHVLMHPTHAVEARASAGGLRGVMSTVAWDHRAKGIQEERCLKESFTASSRGVEACVCVNAVTNFGRVQHPAERDPLPPRATIFALCVGADRAADCGADVTHETGEHARVARTERVFGRVALKKDEQVSRVRLFGGSHWS